jgi:hypothetical protein
MTWKEFFEKAQQDKRDVAMGSRLFKILSVGDGMVHLGFEKDAEHLSYNGIIHVGNYKANGKTLTVYTVASADDVQAIQQAVELVQEAVEQAE